MKLGSHLLCSEIYLNVNLDTSTRFISFPTIQILSRTSQVPSRNIPEIGKTRCGICTVAKVIGQVPETTKRSESLFDPGHAKNMPGSMPSVCEG